MSSQLSTPPTGQPSGQPTGQPALYGGRWPKWRTAPSYRQTAFTAWLELHCEQRRLSRMDLARHLSRELPYKRGYTSIYNAITGWVRDRKLPSYDYVRALSRVLSVPESSIVDLIQPSKAQRAASATVAASPALALPPPPPARNRMRPPSATAAEIQQAAEADLWRSIRGMPEFDALVRPFVEQRLRAQGLAGRVVPGVPGEAGVPAPADEALERDSEQEGVKR